MDGFAQAQKGKMMNDLISRQAAIEVRKKVHRVFRDLNLSCAYGLPSFWANKGKDYVVIPTKFSKGYQQALEDAEKAIVEALQPLVLTCDGCRHVGTYDTDFPCSVCIRREKDYYEQEQ